MRILFTLTTALACITISNLSAQPGTLDSTFGVNGKETNIDSVYNAAICIQPDGRIVVLGTHGQVDNYHPNYFVLLRHNIDGSLDSSFGINGRVDTYFDSGPDFGLLATSLLIQPDGKLVAGGYKWGSAQPQYYILARYLIDGTLDSTFGENGKVIHDIGPFPKENELEALGVQKNGKIVAGGWSDGYCVVRYTANGRVDSSFANNGILRDQNVWTGPVADLFFLKSGEIITACQNWGSFDVPADNFQINRLTTEGFYDSSFGNNGFVLTDFYGGSDNPFSLLQLSDSSFISGGYSNDSTNTRYTAFAEYKKNGRLFNSFGTNGKATIPSPVGGNRKLMLQKDGKIISAGGLLVRLDTAGRIDSTFGNNGMAANFLGALDAVLQPDGKIVTMNTGILQRFIGKQPEVSIAKNISLTEGNTGYTAAKFKIVLSNTSASTVKVNYITKDGTAQAGSDYVSISGMVTFKPGIVSKTVTVNVIGDNTYESNEKFSLVLSNPVNVLLGDLDSATCTIKNDDPLSPQFKTNSNAVIKSPIKLFPNPAKDELTIQGLSTQHATISVVDMQGKILIEASGNNQKNSINVKQLSAGIYYLRIETGDNVTTLKFVKQ